MSFYLDTSALVCALTREAEAPRVNKWLRAREPATVLISEWTHTEVASALALKLRTGALTLEARAEAASVFAQLAANSLPTLAVTTEHFETAAHFAARHDLGLRAGDALHLAIARQTGLSVVTLDNQMAGAALELGIPVEHF
ncbi:type II toxin-antitoxin system VapC family toxin [Sphingomonas sp. Root241]|uniref:type II toxin-antitoxin system VapC family toxin n=1 Tax=Sphingomonas sp. Root241 TaxID=1736501 RepID=UPI0006F2B051|nr:type II toxin-antitoxin system VapC family toxin [Sphingomonas sp. Root241]KRC82091.1 twitching motility protein PilT [Sphingomonas sp. Root241]